MKNNQGAPAAKSPIGGGPSANMHMAGAKARDFKGSMKKMLVYLKSSLAVIVVAIILAAAGVVLTLRIPSVLGDATDEIIMGIMKQNVYDSVMEQAAQMPAGMAMPKTLGELLAIMPDGEKVIENIPAQYHDGLQDASLDTRPTIDIGAVSKIIITLAILVVISSLLSYLQSFLMSGVAQRISYKMRGDINLKMNKLPLAYYDSTTHGEVLSLITNDVDTVSTTLNQSLAQMITSVTTIIGIFVMMLTISGWLTLASLIALPLSALFIKFIVGRSQKHFRAQQSYLGHVNGHIEEMYSGHAVVRLFNGGEKSIEKFKTMNAELYSAGWKSQFLSGLMMPVLGFISNISYVVVCVLGGILTINGRITIGNIQSFIQYVRRFNQPIAQSATIMNTLQSTAAAAERIFGFLEAEEEKDSGTKQLPATTRGEVKFENVDFGYKPDKTIIHKFSTQVEPGQRIAIVGPTGAGKTTIVKLLLRFYELHGGAIYIDGENINNYSRNTLRSQIGMVLQETWLFNGTIRENIRYGRLDATNEEVERAAKMASADHFIKTLPGGYDFELNEEAGNVSHGQKQLLTIARAILADPAVLILDEATSSVDTRTEVLIQRAMNNLMQGRTSFIIAHRLSTIRDADKILVLRDGDIIEQGNHEELIEKGGFYCTLYNSQFEPDEAV